MELGFPTNLLISRSSKVVLSKVEDEESDSAFSEKIVSLSFFLK